MKFVKLAVVLAMALCLTASVYAETQSVKVSGDLTVRGIGRSNYDYRGSVPAPEGSAADPRTGFPDAGDANVGVAGPDTAWWMSTTEVQIDAELTDNVSSVIRIVNERDWNVQTKAIDGATPTTLAPIGLGGYTPRGDDFSVDLDLAYVSLKNFIYCPLSVTIGRQDLWFGKGFIVGSNFVYNSWVSRNNGNMLSAPEYTTKTAFDSIKAVLDYDPWTITAVYSKLWENAIADFDDINLWGVNLGYKFDRYNAEAEAYWFWKQDRSIEVFGAAATWPKNDMSNDVHTIGMRGSMDPIDTVTISGEAAFQLGSYVGSRAQYSEIPRQAFALDFALEWRGLMEKFAWKPKMGAEYILYSGEETSTNAQENTGVYNGWDPMFRGKFDSAIREFVGIYNTSYDYRAQATNFPTNPDAAYTNQHQIIFSGSVQPMESVTLKGNCNMFWLYAPILASNPGIAQGAGSDLRKGYIGTEFDFQAIWDYTEDVSFGLLAAWFVPGVHVYDNANEVATDLVGTVKVSF